MNSFKFNQLPFALGRTVQSDAQSFLYFGGTAYLGIPRNEAFFELYMDGARKYGLNNGTSRSNNVQLGIYEAAEAFAAARFGAAAALITSSGFLAAQMAVSHFSNCGQVIYAPASHPALWSDGNPHTSGSFGYWSRHVVELINRSKTKRWVLISNTMNNLFPERYDFSFLTQIHDDKEVLLIADDSHGIGVLGHGRGCYTSLPERSNIHCLVVASMAKALGVDAGLILGSEALITSLKQTPVFLGASPPAAAGLYAFMEAGAIYDQELERLMRLCDYFNNRLGSEKAAFASMEGFPVYLSEDQHLSDHLLARDVLISSFAYPDQHGELLNRIVLSSWHQKADIDALLNRIYAK